MASVIDLDRVRRNDDRLSTLQLILSGAVDLPALKQVLRVNTKVSEVIIYVDESFLVELPVEETHDLFRTIGGMPNLQKLGFHSQSGSSGVLSIQALIAITSHATRMVHFGISDVALWGTQADFALWATQLQTQLFLQSFCVCECELLEPSKECPLDPLLTVLSILPSLEALFLQAATPNALGQVSPEAVGAIGMAPQLQDLRLGNFELKHGHMEQMSRVLPYNTVLTELKLDACHEFKLETSQAMAKILKHNRRLKSLELGLTSMMSDDCAVTIAKSLHYNTTLESFTLSRGANTRFRPAISKACQQAFVEMLHQNYVLETLVLFQRFPVKKEFKLYLTLNKYGRGKLLNSHSTQRAQWIQAIHKVNDDLDSIFYYMSINPSLCSHCFDDEDQDEGAEDEQRLLSGTLAPNSACGMTPYSPGEVVNSFFYNQVPTVSGHKRPRQELLQRQHQLAYHHQLQHHHPAVEEANAYLRESQQASSKRRAVPDVAPAELHFQQPQQQQQQHEQLQQYHHPLLPQHHIPLQLQQPQAVGPVGSHHQHLQQHQNQQVHHQQHQQFQALVPLDQGARGDSHGASFQRMMGGHPGELL